MSGSTGFPWKTRAPGRWFKTETLAVLVVTATLAVLYLTARDLGPFQAMEGAALDWRFQLRGPQVAGREIALVAIDDATLADLGRWPISRTWMAAAADAIAQDGARAIVFDLLFIGTEDGSHGDSSPQTGDSSGSRPREAATAADREFAAAVARAGNVLIPFAFVYHKAQANFTDLPDVIQMGAYRVVRSAVEGYADLPLHPEGILAPPLSLLAAARTAHVTVFVEADGSLRFSQTAIAYGDSLYPSLPVEAARIFLGVDQDRVRLDIGQGLAIGDRFFATHSAMSLPINYAGPTGSFETWSLIDVVKGRFAPGSFRDRLVLIGPTAVGLGDRFETPYSAMLPGVEVFANVIDNFLERGFLHRSSLELWIDLGAIALGGLLGAALGLLHRPALAMLIALAALVAWSALNAFAFIAWQTWLNFTFPALAILLGASIIVLGLTLRETRRRVSAERRGETLSRYVSPLTASGLQDQGSRAQGLRAQGSRASDQTHMAAIMFVDLVGFTQISEKLSPPGTAQLLRQFHGCVERAAQAHGGVIDKYIGDAVLVVFGVKGAGPSDVANAVVCARQILREVVDWSAQSAIPDTPGLSCGVGIDFGPVTLAEVGGSVHAQFTVTGDTVNVASRLEALTREWHAAIIVSESVVSAIRAADAGEMLDGFEVLPVQQVRGRETAMRLWALPSSTLH